MGDSSKLFKELYQEGLLYSSPSMSFEFGENFAHILISSTSKDPDKVYEKTKLQIKKFLENGIPPEDFKRIKKMLYGEYIKEYDDVTEIARMFLSDFMKGINSFEYLDNLGEIDLYFVNKVLAENFKKEKMVLSVVK